MTLSLGAHGIGRQIDNALLYIYYKMMGRYYKQKCATYGLIAGNIWKDSRYI